MYYKLHFNVVERLKYYMKLRNMNAYQLTQKTQLSENTIPNLLKKKNGLPRLDTLLDILQGLNVSVSEFFGETERDTLEPDEERLLNNYIGRGKKESAFAPYLRGQEGEEVNSGSVLFLSVGTDQFETVCPFQIEFGAVIVFIDKKPFVLPDAVDMRPALFGARFFPSAGKRERFGGRLREVFGLILNRLRGLYGLRGHKGRKFGQRLFCRSLGGGHGLRKRGGFRRCFGCGYGLLRLFELKFSLKLFAVICFITLAFGVENSAYEMPRGEEKGEHEPQPEQGEILGVGADAPPRRKLDDQHNDEV